MNLVLLPKSLMAWLLILCLAIANRSLREAVLISFLGKTIGLVLSGVLLALLVLLVAYGFVHFGPGFTVRQGAAIGLLWLLLTLAFEFSFGHYVQHKPWTELLEAYTFKEGNIWPLVLVATLLAPFIAALLRSRLRHTNSRA